MLKKNKYMTDTFLRSLLSSEDVFAPISFDWLTCVVLDAVHMRLIITIYSNWLVVTKYYSR